MATAARLARFSDPAVLDRRPSSMGVGLGGRFAWYRLYRATLSQLAALSDRELADLGVQRGAIRELALSAAYEA